jgi:hypothetical protein
MVEWLPQGITVNSVVCYSILTHLCRKIQQQPNDKWAQKVFVLHGIARPYTSRQTTRTLVPLGFSVLPNPPYPQDFAPSGYALFD